MVNSYVNVSQRTLIYCLVSDKVYTSIIKQVHCFNFLIASIALTSGMMRMIEAVLGGFGKYG